MKYQVVNRVQIWLKKRILERLSNVEAAAEYINAKRPIDQAEYQAFKKGLRAAQKIIEETSLI